MDRDVMECRSCGVVGCTAAGNMAAGWSHMQTLR